MRTLDEIEAERTAKENLIRTTDNSLDTVMAEIYSLDRQIVGLEERKSELRESARKARHILRGLNMEIKQLTNEWFRRREQGRGAA